MCNCRCQLTRWIRTDAGSQGHERAKLIPSIKLSLRNIVAHAARVLCSRGQAGWQYSAACAAVEAHRCDGAQANIAGVDHQHIAGHWEA